MTAEFRVLGSVEALVDGQAIDLGHARRRAVLAALLVDANELVPMDQLADRVWGDDRPREVTGTIYSYLSRLRQSLGGLDGVELIRRAGGYVLCTDPSTVDLHRFRRLAADARAAQAARAVELFDKALSLFRGEPFAGLDTAWLCGQREAVLAHRHAAELDRNDAALALGRHGQLLAELTARAEAHPFDERLASQLMLALYRCGRQADALDRYQRVRLRLATELGADPSPMLSGLHQRILIADPELELRIADQPEGARAVPRQLPAPPPAFVGRAEQLVELGRTLPTGSPRAAVAIASISGSGGVGKSWFALQWANSNISQFPDGQLYVDLRGFDPAAEPLLPEVAVRGFLEALGVPPTAVPTHLDGQSALYRSLTLGRRMLVLLDNARDSAQVAPLLPSSPSCTVLVTSRHTLTGLVTAHGASPVMLGMLTDAEGRELLARQLGPQRLAAEPDAAVSLVAHCAGLPLALGIVAARALVHPELPLESLATELRGASTRLDALDAGELVVNLRAVLACSLAALSDRARDLFPLLGLTLGPDASLASVASLAGLPIARVRPLLSELIHAHLLQESAPRRYRMHDLVRLFAAERARSDGERARAATLRMLDFHLRSALAADGVLSPGRAHVDLGPPMPGVVSESIADAAAAEAWFVTERPVVAAAVGRAVAEGSDSLAWQLAAAWHNFLGLREHWHDMCAISSIAVAAADRMADPVARAYAHRGLGVGSIGLRRYEQAGAHLTHALEAAQAAGDPTCLAFAHRSLGRLFARQGRFAEALRHDERSLELWVELGNEFGQATALNAAGWHLAHLGDYDAAVRRCERALALFERLDDRLGAALTWDSLGYARRQLGEFTAAVECYRRSVELCRELHHDSHTARTLVSFGETLLAGGDGSAARGPWQEALSIYEYLGAPEADTVRELLRRS